MEPTYSVRSTFAKNYKRCSCDVFVHKENHSATMNIFVFQRLGYHSKTNSGVPGLSTVIFTNTNGGRLFRLELKKSLYISVGIYLPMFQQCWTTLCCLRVGRLNICPTVKLFVASGTLIGINRLGFHQEIENKSQAVYK